MLCRADRSMFLFSHPERRLKIETPRPPDTSSDIHGKMGGSTEGGRKTRERMIQEPLLAAMMA